MKAKNLTTNIASILNVFGFDVESINLNKPVKTRYTFIAPGEFLSTWQEAVGAIRAIVELFPGHDVTHTDESIEFTFDLDGLTLACHIAADEEKVTMDLDPTIGGHYIAYKNVIYTAGSDESESWVNKTKAKIDVVDLLPEIINVLEENEAEDIFKQIAKLLVKKTERAGKSINKEVKKAVKKHDAKKAAKKASKKAAKKKAKKQNK